MMVASPILNTTPLAFPLVQRVPKKAMFLVSRILSGSVHWLLLIWGSLSPVREELSTFKSSHWKILISAGTLSPSLTSIMSPVTSLQAGISSSFPSQRHLHIGGMKFLNPSIIDLDLLVCRKLKVPVKKITKIKMIARERLEGSEVFIPYSAKQSAEPIQRIIEKKVVSSWK